eukprot:359186-Chlamydomonas_euryale.AAC.3
MRGSGAWGRHARTHGRRVLRLQMHACARTDNIGVYSLYARLRLQRRRSGFFLEVGAERARCAGGACAVTSTPPLAPPPTLPSHSTRVDVGGGGRRIPRTRKRETSPAHPEGAETAAGRIDHIKLTARMPARIQQCRQPRIVVAVVAQSSSSKAYASTLPLADAATIGCKIALLLRFCISPQNESA